MAGAGITYFWRGLSAGRDLWASLWNTTTEEARIRLQSSDSGRTKCLIFAFYLVVASIRWSRSIAEYRKVLNKWSFKKPTALVNFDSPLRKQTLGTQIARARKVKDQFASTCSGLNARLRR